MKVLVWSWNSESARFSESVESRRAESSIEWTGALPTLAIACEPPSFVRAMAERVHEEQPELVVVGLQEDPKPGSYWLSDALPQLLTGYALLEKTRLMGVGLTTWTRCYSMRGLRLSVFVKQDWAPAQHIQASVYEHVCRGAALTRNKGGVAIVLDIPGHGKLELINAHLPFDSSSLGTFRQRHEAKQKQADHLEQLHAALVLGAVQPLADHVILMGDLNFRLDVFLTDEPSTVGPQGIADRLFPEFAELGPNAVYRKRDELLQVLEQSAWLRGYREGADDQGPDFAPTCKLRKQRPAESAELSLDWLRSTLQVQAEHGSLGPRTPGFADRILFRSFAGHHGTSAADSHSLRCTAYERWDLSPLSDHAAVMAVLDLTA